MWSITAATNVTGSSGHLGEALVRVLGEEGNDLIGAERFLRRSEDDRRPEHGDAAILLDRAGGREALAEMHSHLEEVVRSRPNTRTVEVVEEDLEETYVGLLRAIHGG
jgi:nucleoside-diphosphate-sugar epimerase